uniref:Uncharacterized protein n=1 Tax=Chromera velia CCMP2878 TaxID=1169474 RepID=A0A0G4G482_9ALVE|eukprot:Cvel_20177.t1-p1 / transcript=Cvel_20177.t1 / gene=Cvel_20177 / organism=Chromera_velia_CCMP2878 / gene_product=hypothetical protein / transcript_product=hypothetical protein / location=Cvel_scaffold1793:25393-31093(+) / protein_length=242 / sequence_SO=supercontig / SO=protein_coding / is_pseudo=false
MPIEEFTEQVRGVAALGERERGEIAAMRRELRELLREGWAALYSNHQGRRLHEQLTPLVSDRFKEADGSLSCVIYKDDFEDEDLVTWCPRAHSAVQHPQCIERLSRCCLCKDAAPGPGVVRPMYLKNSRRLSPYQRPSQKYAPLDGFAKRCYVCEKPFQSPKLAPFEAKEALSHAMGRLVTCQQRHAFHKDCRTSYRRKHDEETGSKGRQRGERDLGREEKEKEREREIKGTQEEVREGVQL